MMTRLFTPSANPGIAVFAPGATLNGINCAPSTVFTGNPFNNSGEAGITLDPAGNVYLVNPLTNVITEFTRATVTGGWAVSPAVLRTLTVAAGASGASGMTVGP